MYNKPARADDEEDNVIEDISEAEEDAGPSVAVDEYDEQEEPYEEEEVEQDLRRRNMSPLREVKPGAYRFELWLLPCDPIAHDSQQLS